MFVLLCETWSDGDTWTKIFKTTGDGSGSEHSLIHVALESSALSNLLNLCEWRCLSLQVNWKIKTFFILSVKSETKRTNDKSLNRSRLFERDKKLTSDCDTKIEISSSSSSNNRKLLQVSARIDLILKGDNLESLTRLLVVWISMRFERIYLNDPRD